MTQKFITVFLVSAVFTFPKLSWGDHYVQGFSLSANQQKTEVTLEQFVLDKPNLALRLQEIQGDCNPGPEQDMIESCAHTAVINMNSFEFDVRVDGSSSDEKKILQLAEEAPQISGEGKFWKFRFHKFNLEVKDSHYDFEFSRASWPHISVHSEGVVTYNKSRKILNFKVKKLKLGLLDVTRVVFEFVKLITMPKGVTVSYPNVEINLQAQ